jgi:hypothetical protein
VPAVAIVNPDGTNIGGSGGTSMTDSTAFVQGASSLTPAGFLGDDAADALGANERIGVARMNRATRVLFVQLKDNSGNDVSPGDRTVGALTNRSGSISSGGSSQQLAAANATRRYLFIQNIATEDLWFNFGTAAVADQPSVRLRPGDSFVMEGLFIDNQAIHIIGATTGSRFVAKEGG